MALSTLPALAREIPAPFNICSGFNCPEAMKEINTEFLAAGGIETKQVPFVVSGECYHRSSYYNPSTKHYGVTLIDSKDGEFFSGGSFGFFYKENPYADWTVEIAREKSKELYQPNHKVFIEPTFGFADMNPGGKPENTVHYWYRQNSEHFYILGQWGYSQAFVCRLQKNNP